MILRDSQLKLVEHHRLWQVWDGAAVIFEPCSGDTHRIDPPGGSILALLADSNHSRADIHLALNCAYAAENQRIDKALDLLLALELVEFA